MATTCSASASLLLLLPFFLSLQKQHNVVFDFTKIYLHINSIYLHATREISDPATNSLIAVAGLS